MRKIPVKITIKIATLISALSLFVPVIFYGLEDRVVWAGEFNPKGWKQPNIYGSERYFDDTTDFDRTLKGEETRLEKFRTHDGGRIYRYSYKGHVFAYDVDHDQKYPLDYQIMDLDGDGIFETRQSPYNEYPLPPWTYQ